MLHGKMSDDWSAAGYGRLAATFRRRERNQEGEKHRVSRDDGLVKF